MKNCLNCEHRINCNTLKKIIERIIEDHDEWEIADAFASEEKETFFCCYWKEDK